MYMCVCFVCVCVCVYVYVRMCVCTCICKHSILYQCLRGELCKETESGYNSAIIKNNIMVS